MIYSARKWFLLVLVSLAGAVSADELMEASRGLCDNVKTCALEQIAEEDMTPEMRGMMEPMLQNMCTAMNSKVGEVPTGHGHYKWAVACIRSMQSLSCAQLQDPDQAVTPECEQYEKMAREASGQ